MASVQLAGLISGFDWQSFIDTMISAQGAPITRLQTDKANNAAKISALSTMSTRFTELQTTANALKAEGLFAGRTAKSTTSGSTWGANASNATAAGAYTFNVTQLATQARLNGASGFSRGLNNSNDVSGVTIASLSTATAVTEGKFTVNGAQVTVAATDSLADVLNRVSTATSGAVTASYNSTSDRIELSSSGEIVLGASNDTSNFLSVMKLRNTVGATSIQSSATLGSAGLNTPLASARLDSAITAVDGAGDGSFTINGVAIAFNVNTDTLNSVIGKINASSAGVTALYDPANDSISLMNKTTGDVGVSVSDVAGGFLDAVGLRTGATLVRGNNASFSVNGGPTLTSTTNTLDATSHGINGLSVSATSQTSETITVSANTEAMKTAINNFVTKFNDVQNLIEQQTKITVGKDKKVSTSTLSSNREVQAWSSTLRNMAFSTLSGLSGSINDLGDLGIGFSSTTPTLSVIDPAKLDAALNNNPSDVEAFFKDTTNGFSAKFDSFAKTILGASGTGSGGLLGAQTDTLNAQNTSIDTQIAAIQRSLESQRSQLQASFIAMENAQAQIKQMQQQLSQALGTTSSG